ncbi:hypothetical protein O181_045276 [Austropuccinia psidii MF-1]|uniref:Uncharacterized protein n=1 Tax=Austropuccinia psidii MF-1 TaxID=1389203 RepID=A0A9Q3DJX5_9BASI|nr:hypothetical protein [Austropuccinia psidii MF-1]
MLFRKFFLVELLFVISTRFIAPSFGSLDHICQICGKPLENARESRLPYLEPVECSRCSGKKSLQKQSRTRKSMSGSTRSTHSSDPELDQGSEADSESYPMSSKDILFPSDSEDETSETTPNLFHQATPHDSDEDLERLEHEHDFHHPQVIDEITPNNFERIWHAKAGDLPSLDRLYKDLTQRVVSLRLDGRQRKR